MVPSKYTDGLSLLIMLRVLDGGEDFCSFSFLSMHIIRQYHFTLCHIMMPLISWRHVPDHDDVTAA
jgi:hypothetical protein